LGYWSKKEIGFLEIFSYPSKRLKENEDCCNMGVIAKRK
jgi:hypothetical protein